MRLTSEEMALVGVIKRLFILQSSITLEIGGFEHSRNGLFSQVYCFWYKYRPLSGSQLQSFR